MMKLKATEECFFVELENSHVFLLAVIVFMGGG